MDLKFIWTSNVLNASLMVRVCVLVCVCLCVCAVVVVRTAAI